MTNIDSAFRVQRRVRGPWRRFLDCLAPFRSDLHRYCCRLTGNVWDGEDLVQDTLIRVFGMLGKIDAQLDNPKGYLIRTATNLWIDRVRRATREQQLLQLEQQDEPVVESDAAAQLDASAAARDLLQRLRPQERAAVVLKDVLDYSLEETAAVLKTSVAAVKSALHRGRGRVTDKAPSSRAGPSRELVETFMQALAGKDLAKLEQLCVRDLSVEMVGGAQSESFEQSRMFFTHAHTVLPVFGFGLTPRWELIEFEGEPMVVGFRTLDGVEGVNEVHRLEVHEGVITRVRLYCFAPDALRAVAQQRGVPIVERPIAYRSPSLPDVPWLLWRALLRKLRPQPASRSSAPSVQS